MVDFHQLTSAADIDAAFALRHRVCVEELGWVPPCPDGRETDGWDDGALHVGAFAGRTLLRQCYATVRALGRGTTSDGGTNSVVLVELASRRPAESRTAC